MKAVLDEYLKRADNLISYIVLVQDLNNIAFVANNEPCSEKIIQLNMLQDKRIYDYNLIVITLYGILESYIEQIVKSYLLTINAKIKDFKDLPKVIKDNHLVFSANLINYIFCLNKYGNISVNKVIQNLNSCISNNITEYSLNVDAFTYHAANFRMDSIRDFFKNLGINNITRSIYQTDLVRDFFMQKEQCNLEELGKRHEDYYYAILQDLVERRNLISHGVDSDELLSLDILKEYINYVKVLIRAIFEILDYNLNLLLFQKTDKVKLGTPIKIINNKIVCINNNNIEIKEGDNLYAMNHAKEFRYGKIISIQINSVPVASTCSGENVPVGLCVDFYAKENYEYYICL